jgi:hypothetical protein
MRINQVEIEHIERLNDVQLTKLLHTLLQIELQKNSINVAAFVPCNITTGDGGEDGRVQWVSEPDDTKWLKNRFCLFQTKATTLGPSACYEEILKPKIQGKHRELKPQIEELVKANGCYILFTNKNLNKNKKQFRIDKFREAIKDTGYANYVTLRIEVYDTNSIKDWVNENIGTVTIVQKFNEISRPGFKIWIEWEKTFEDSNIPYKKNEIINSHFDSIYESLEHRRPIRIIGHSGLGKTRLTLEAFRNSETNPDIESLQKQVVYFEIGIDGKLEDLNQYIISNQNQEGILIIDSCDEEDHKVLSGLIKKLTKFRLITIDTATNTSEETSLKIDRDHQRDIVKNIIDEILGETHGQSDRDYLNNICEGYPWMAVKFCTSIQKNGITDFSGSLPKDFIKRLLFGKNVQNELEYDIIRACSVFSTFGFLDDELRPILNEQHQECLEKQMEFIRTQVYDGNITESKFYEICQKYKSKDIIEHRGTQYIVKPTILAINLASDWLLNTPSKKIINILKDLKGQSLSQKFVERLKDLDQLDKAKNIVHELWGPNSPFGSAEVLNTEWGSLLFRYVVEVNPLSTANALQTAFGGLSKKEILNIKEGRRNLVWALEKLCFRKETFNIGAKILYSFGVSENETWANNATNQFIQLFQLFLSGTEANLIERLEIIKYGLEKNDEEYNKIAILALGRAILNDHFTRSGGAEKQGSKVPLKDYQPCSWDEIFNYWEQAVLILIDFTCTDNVNSALSKKELANAYRTLVRDGKVDIVIQSFQRIAENSEVIWLDGINSLKRIIEFEKGLNNKVVKEIEELINNFTPDDIEVQLFLNVTKPEWDVYEKDNKGDYIDKPKLRAEAFAESLITKNENWFEYLPKLLQGEQRQAFNFGKKLGELLTEKKEFINKAFDAFKTIPEDLRNIELIGGFIQGSKDESLKEYVIDIVSHNKSYNQYAFYLTRIVEIKLKNLEKLFDIIDNNDLSISYFKSFQYGRVLDNLNTKEVISFCEKISLYGKEGQWIALSLIYMYCLHSKEKWNRCKSFIKDLISKENMLIDISKIANIDVYYWSDSIINLISETDNVDFAKKVTCQMIDFCIQPVLNYSSYNHLQKVLRILVEKYNISIWPIIGEGLIGDYITYSHLKYMIGIRNIDRKHKEYIFENKLLNIRILEWMRKYPEIAPMRIANMMPLEDSNLNVIKWHKFSKTIIDEFGDQEEVLKALSANMGTYGITGSSVPYYKKQKLLLELLINHPISTVRQWAKQMIEYTDKYIRYEELNDEERYL